MMKRAPPFFFISHGDGPWSRMDGMTTGSYSKLARSLRHMASDAGGQPQAILMVYAHWEGPVFTGQSNPHPPIMYDYYRFLEHTYEFQYASAGAPTLAARVAGVLREAGLGARLDADKGYDHGMYPPMAIAYPDQDMPSMQLSLVRGLDPTTHIELGQALAPLRDEDVLLVGSGLSYHNLAYSTRRARYLMRGFEAGVAGGGARYRRCRPSTLH